LADQQAALEKLLVTVESAFEACDLQFKDASPELFWQAKVAIGGAMCIISCYVGLTLYRSVFLGKTGKVGDTVRENLQKVVGTINANPYAVFVESNAKWAFMKEIREYLKMPCPQVSVAEPELDVASPSDAASDGTGVSPQIHDHEIVVPTRFQ
jgi:hypothetical protein